MTDQWAEVSWSFVEPGDFVKMKGLVWRVDEKTNALGVFPRYSVTLYRPEGSQNGKISSEAHVLIRIGKDGKRTPAGQRDDGLTDEGEAALKRLLGAETTAARDVTGREFNPWVLPERMTPDAIAMHLVMFHELYTGDATSKDATLLRETHATFHAADWRTQPATARRVPHIHSDKEFVKLS